MATSTFDRTGITVRPTAAIWSKAVGAGQIAGLVMAAVVMVVFAVFLRHSLLYPVQLMGSLILGSSHLHERLDASAFLVGFFAHQLGPALLWSLVFAAVVSIKQEAWTAGELFALGVGIALASELVDVYVVMPFFQRAVNGHDLWRENVPRFWDWAAHLVYGLALAGAYLSLRGPHVRAET